MIYSSGFLGFASVGAFLGAVGSFLLLLPPLVDQLRRWFVTKRKADVERTTGKLKDLSQIALTNLEKEASRWKPWESFVLTLGGALLMISFWIG